MASPISVVKGSSSANCHNPLGECNNNTDKCQSTFQLVESFGRSRLSNPHGVTLSYNGDIVVADRGNHSVQFFTWSCYYMTCVHMVDGGPTDICAMRYQRFCVTDANNGVVRIITQDGRLVRKIGEGILIRPIGIATLSDNIFVVDSDNHCVLNFSKLGRVIKKIGSYGNGDAQFCHPSFIAVNGKGELIVSDSGNSRVIVVSQNGECIFSIDGKSGEDVQFRNPRGVAVDFHDNIYVASDHRVLMFSPRGRFLCLVVDDASLEAPTGLEVTKRNPCEIVVSDSSNNCIRVYTGYCQKDQY
uniref:Tripartite motif-containing protein 2-like n=1 Tax=Saccoglossus kowalevskii TaxID=10224 RepID=A0ABM0M2U3_SACKO|nr:PREDICTED: tripartite motif-containing protein 2-like [Saccoglossus kowalevskii]